MSHLNRSSRPLFSFINLTIACFVCVSTCTGSSNADSLENTSEIFVKTLFGDLWKFNQYCSSNFTDDQIQTVDQEILSFYDESYLNSLEGSPNWPVAANQLDSLDRIGLESRQRLAILCGVASWGYADPAEEELSNAPHDDDSECLRQLERFYQFVETLVARTRTGQKNCHLGDRRSLCVTGNKSNRSDETSEASFNVQFWKQFHSFGRLRSGPPYKQNLLPGDFDGCLRLKSTRYCLGAYGRGTEAKSHLVGLCLPRSCSSRFLRQSAPLMAKLDTMISRNMPEVWPNKQTDSGREVVANHLSDVFCPPANDSPYMNPLKDKLSVAFVMLHVVWILLLIYATFIRSQRISAENSSAPSLLDSFNLTANWKRFLDDRHLDRRLTGLNAIKTLAMFWLMLTHFSMIILPYIQNFNELKSYYMTTLHGPIVLQGQHGVPIFFVISGILFGFKYLNKSTDVARVILWRYFRLMPMYLLVYTYTKKFAHLIGDGPIWDSGVSVQSELRQCSLESWFVPFLMLANFMPPFAHCLLTGWHIANDFQIYLVIPILVMIYRRSRTFGRLASMSVFMITHLTRTWFWGTSMRYDLRRLMLDPVRFGPRYVLDRLALDYVNPVGRMGTYFVGVLIADLLLEKAQTIKSYSSEQRAEANRAAMEAAAKSTVKGGQQATKRGSCEQSQIDRISSGVSLVAADRRSSQPALGHQAGELGKQLTNVTFSKSAGDGREQQITERRDNGQDGGERAGHEPPTAASSDKCVIVIDENSLLLSFKDKCLLATVCSLTVTGLFSVFFSPDGPLSALPAQFTKALAYPLCRFAVEIGWSVLLYYFLLTNLRPTKAGKSLGPAAATSRSASPSAAASATAEARENLLMINDETTTNKSRAQTGDQLKTTTKAAATTTTTTALLKRDDQEEPLLVRVLKWPIWNVLVKVNYAIMLTHYGLFRFIVLIQRDLFLFSWFNFGQMITFLVLLTYLVSLVMHLAIEMPLTALVQRLVSKILSARPAKVAS